MFWRRTVALTAGTALVSIGLAVAQPDPSSSTATVETTQVAPPVVEETASPEEQLAEAKRIAEQAKQTCGSQAQMLNAARRERDIIRATCVDDKLTQCNANLQTLDTHIQSLQESIKLGDNRRRKHEFTVVKVLEDKFSGLRQAANQCIGQDIFETGATTVTTEKDPNAPDEDPTVVPPLPEPEVPYIPPPVSGVS